MSRDIFGNLVKEDIFGRKISKKQIKREVLEENRRKGRAGEDYQRTNSMLRGAELKRTGRGHDFIETKRDLFTGRVTKTYIEVKTGNAKLSKLQQKKKKKGNYRVERYNPSVY